MAAAARGFMVSRVAYLSPKLHPPPPQFSRRVLFPWRISAVTSSSSSAAVTTTVCCLSSGSEFVSTRNSVLDRGFSVIANMLERIEPLDTAVISNGVSDSAIDSMKETISTMLGLLPSDQFSVVIKVSKHPLDRLLTSAIITGYTLWNAEYRISLMRNLDASAENSKKLKSQIEMEDCGERGRESESGGAEPCFDDLETSPQVLRDLPRAALNFIQQLQSELSDAKQELNARKEETGQMEFQKGNRNDLLKYLRSLDSDMVMELSRPSSVEIEDIIHQLVQNVSRRFFKDDSMSEFMENPIIADMDNLRDIPSELCETVGTSRDYLAKLLFWFMLLGHHLRGLENRLHLSCVVGLL